MAGGDAFAISAQEIVEVCRPAFAGKHPGAQGAALADLTAIWLAGHLAIGDPLATYELRDLLLKHHIRAVRTLIEVNAKALGTDV